MGTIASRPGRFGQGERGESVAAFRSAETGEVILRRSRLKARRRGLVPRRLQPEGGSAQKHPPVNAETPQQRRVTRLTH
jgi:hypothetical protein